MTGKRLTSVNNPRIKHACRLREGGYRRQQGQFLIDGPRETLRAWEAGVELVEAFVPDTPAPPITDLAVRLESRGVAVWRVAPPLFERLAFGERRSGIVAVARSFRRGLDHVHLPETPLVAVLESLQKPGNVGAVLRSADAAGVSAVIAVEAGTDLFNPNTIRASLGAVFTVPVAEARSSEALAWLAALGIAVYVARVDAEALYTEVDWRAASAVVFGSEDRGASDLWNPPRATPIRLPMLGHVDSLNVSVASAVVFYEALRQRGAC